MSPRPRAIGSRRVSSKNTRCLNDPSPELIRTLESEPTRFNPRPVPINVDLDRMRQHRSVYTKQALEVGKRLAHASFEFNAHTGPATRQGSQRLDLSTATKTAERELHPLGTRTVRLNRDGISQHEHRQEADAELPGRRETAIHGVGEIHQALSAPVIRRDGDEIVGHHLPAHPNAPVGHLKHIGSPSTPGPQSDPNREMEHYAVRFVFGNALLQHDSIAGICDQLTDRRHRVRAVQRFAGKKLNQPLDRPGAEIHLDRHEARRSDVHRRILGARCASDAL
ncbi:Hypothetical protein I5071_88820 [Sandaracinus amylolyticus]|nr:Hypothetical protein I5071_88820 [Sandaracinus amylolyticus]